MRTVTGLFDTYEDAQQAVNDLEEAGVNSSDISIISGDGEIKSGNYAADGAGAGAGIGALAGGTGGLLAGLGLVAIPGIGPVVAAGWLTATLAGVAAGALAGGATGGLVGALIKSGISEDEAHVYAESMRRGGTIVAARIDETQVDETYAILHRSNRVEPMSRQQMYHKEGWTRFDESAPPYVAEGKSDLSSKRNPSH